MKFNKVLSIVLSLLVIFSLAACNNSSNEGESTSTDNESNVLKIGASPSPHGEILEAAKPLLEEKGIKIEIIEFSDYVLPNTAVDDGSLDANYFQHEPYLVDFNAGNGTSLITAGYIHYEPMGIYAGKSTSLENISDGAKIAVPNDATNESRALKLLEAQGIIKLKDTAGIDATALDIEQNPYNIEIVEVEASQTPAVLADVDFSVINSNYALEAKVVDKIIVVEDEKSEAVKYTNIIAIDESNKDNENIKVLVEVLKSQEIKDFIVEKYGKAVVPFDGNSLS